MGLFKKLTPVDVDGEREVAAAGTSFRPRAVPPAGTEGRFVIVADPKNRADPNAVKVVTGLGHAGYLPREVAVQYSAVLQRAAKAHLLVRVRAEVRPGSFGDGGGWILLWLPDVAAIEEAIARVR